MGADAGTRGSACKGADKVTPRGLHIVIDPGHGGDDPGAVGHELHEARINLAVAKLLVQQLPTPEYEAILSRESDVFVGVPNRVEASNASRAKLFVSLHCNAASSPEANGFEVLYYTGSVKGKALAEAVHRSTRSLFVRDRGIKERGDLCVLRETDCPAVLVEMGFVTHAGDAQLLARPEFWLCLARQIAAGIRAYKP